MNDIINNYINEALSNQWEFKGPVPDDIYETDYPWAPVEFYDDFDAMHKECLANDHLFVGHRQKDRHHSYNHDGWAAITLHGINPTATENYEQYGFNSVEDANYHWTEVCDLFPNTVRFIKSLGYGTYERVRIMKLAPHGYIMPHTDGQGRIFGPVNIAINNPEGCGFYFKEWGKVPFKQGTGCILDIGNEHCVVNNSPEARYHIIIHGYDSHAFYDYVTKQLKEKYE